MNLPPRLFHRLACMLIAMLALATHTAHSQPATPVPIKRMFGVGDNEFLKSAWFKLKPGNIDMSRATMDVSLRQLWDYCDALGITVIRHQDDETTAYLTALVGARRTPLHRLITSHHGTQFAQAAHSRETILYPFDSVQFPEWASRFLTINGGFFTSNLSEKSSTNANASEKWYLADSLASGTVILEDLAFNWDSLQTDEWPTYWNGSAYIRKPNEDLIIDREYPIGEHAFYYDNSLTNWIVVTGHLFESDGEGDLDSNVLKIELTYEIPAGSTFFNDTNVFDTADAHFIRPLATLFVTRGDLMRSGDDEWDDYQEAAIPFDASQALDGLTGPLFANTQGKNESQRINMKVMWMGHDVAVRSIAIRDSIGQLVLGRGAASENFRSLCLTQARHSYGPTSTDTIYRWPVIARAPEWEQQAIHANPFNRIMKLCRDSIVAFDSINLETSSVPAWTETKWSPEVHTRLDDPNANGPAVIAEIVPGVEEWIADGMRLPNSGLVPSIAEHNGGRWRLPELNLTADSIEHVYETNLQMLCFR